MYDHLEQTLRFGPVGQPIPEELASITTGTHGRSGFDQELEHSFESNCRNWMCSMPAVWFLKRIIKTHSPMVFPPMRSWEVRNKIWGMHQMISVSLFGIDPLICTFRHRRLFGLSHGKDRAGLCWYQWPGKEHGRGHHELQLSFDVGRSGCRVQSDQNDQKVRGALEWRSINSAISSFRESVWENLAHMCVLSRRADVAKICLGKMGLFRGARALCAADTEKPETKIAILAIHLNMKVQYTLWSPRTNQTTPISFTILGRGRKCSASIQAVRSTQSVVPIHQWMGKGDRYLYTFWSHPPSKYLLQLCQTSRRDEPNRQSHWIITVERWVLAKRWCLSLRSYEKSGTQTTEVRRMFLDRKDTAGYKAYMAKQNDP